MNTKTLEKKFNKPRLIQIGERQVVARGLTHRLWLDLYYLSMTVSWWWFWFICAAGFIALNGVFASLYLLDTDAVANARAGNFQDALFFSIETLSTVGYGDMYPKNFYGRLLSTIEIFVGMSFIAIMTGLVFSRFSKPEAHIIFARHPVIGTYNGKRALMLRMANARHNNISDAQAKCWLVKMEKNAEGASFRHYYPLPLLNSENPVFTLTWTICHIIDEASPLFRKSQKDLVDKEATLVVSLNGLDENAVQDLYRRKIYSSSDIRWDHEYVVISQQDAEGRTHIDYHKFHDVLPSSRG